MAAGSEVGLRLAGLVLGSVGALLALAPRAGATCGSLGAGFDHTFAVGPDGTAWGFGANFSGQLGDGTVVPPPTGGSFAPVRVLAPLPVVSIAGGFGFSLACLRDGSVWTWGSDEWGALGRPIAGTHDPVPAPVAGSEGCTAVAAGKDHGLVLREDGTVWAWGKNESGQLGDGTTSPSGVPVQVTGLAATAIAAGRDHSLAIDPDGAVWAWGEGSFGELGDGFTNDSSVPIRAQLPGQAVAVDGGRDHSVAVRADGTVWTWGAQSNGCLGDRSPPYQLPARVNGLSGAVAVSALAQHNIVILQDGSVRGFGESQNGELGYDAFPPDFVLSPVQAVGVANVIAITTGQHHTVVMDAAGGIHGFGRGQYGQLATGLPDPEYLPVLSALLALPDAIPGDQGNVLFAVRSGDDVALEFRAAPPAAGGHRMHRDGVKTSLGLTPIAPDATGLTYVDPGRVRVASTDFYRLKGLSCGLEPGP